MAKTKEERASELRIVDQTRTTNGREYDFACGEGRLTVNVQPLDGAAAEAGWRVELRGKRRGPGGVTVTTAESGASRVEALRAAGREWQSAASPEGLDIFNWQAVEELLGTVRAL